MNGTMYIIHYGKKIIVNKPIGKYKIHDFDLILDDDDGDGDDNGYNTGNSLSNS